MMAQLEKQLNIPVKLMLMPWKQCLAELKAGKVDGAMNASFNTERAEFVRISAIVDAHFSLIVDGESASFWMYWGGAQAPG